MKQILNKSYSSVVATVWNLLLVYLVYQIARCEYYLENTNYLNYTSDVFKGGLLFDTSAIIYTNALYIVLMLLPWHKKESRGYHQFCKWLYLIINGVALAVNLSDSVYFQYTMRRTTTTVFDEFSNEGNLGSIIGTEFLNHWYLVLLFFIVMILLWRLYAKPKAITNLQYYYVANTIALLIAIPLSVAGIRGGFTTAVRPITISNANQSALRPTDAALVLNTPFSLIRTIGKNVFVVPRYFESEGDLEAVFSPIHISTTPNPSSHEEGSSEVRKNIVILIVESFGKEYIGALNKDLEGGRYEGYTPFTDSLISKSTTFRYSYCNGRKSIDGMPSILSSIPMFVEPFILTPASMNDYTGIAGLLAAEGYETAFFHGAQNGSMGFQAFAQKIGFQKYYGRTEYEATCGTDDFDGTWAIWDEPFLQFYAEEMSKMHEPFMTAVFTASSHHPFVVPEQYQKQFPEEGLEIHKCIRYTDMALGHFFQTASRQHWFKNTIFVLTSDHTNMSNHAEYQSDLGGFCSPIIFYDPSHPDGEIQDKVAQQIDILPTVLGLLGLPRNDLGHPKEYIAFGIDVLNTPAENTWAVNYLNGIYQYVRYGYVLQFDGTHTKAFYSLDDRLMKNNLMGKVEVQSQMELELKAIIQRYMERMSEFRLMP